MTEPITPELRAAIRKTHRERLSGESWCIGCQLPWPCEHAMLLDALEAVEQQIAENFETIRMLNDTYREAIGVPPSEHQSRRLEQMAQRLEAAEQRARRAEDYLRAAVEQRVAAEQRARDAEAKVVRVHEFADWLADRDEILDHDFWPVHTAGILRAALGDDVPDGRAGDTTQGPP